MGYEELLVIFVQSPDINKSPEDKINKTTQNKWKSIDHFASGSLHISLETHLILRISIDLLINNFKKYNAYSRNTLTYK